MTVPPSDGFALIKPGQTYFGKQGVTYSAGALKETVGAEKICMNVMPMRPGHALTYAATRTISKAAENSAGTGKMNCQAMMPPAKVATAKEAIIGHTCAASVRAREASCHSNTDCSSMATVSDQPNPTKKSR